MSSSSESIQSLSFSGCRSFSSKSKVSSCLRPGWTTNWCYIGMQRHILLSHEGIVDAVGHDESCAKALRADLTLKAESKMCAVRPNHKKPHSQAHAQHFLGSIVISSRSHCEHLCSTRPLLWVSDEHGFHKIVKDGSPVPHTPTEHASGEDNISDISNTTQNTNYTHLRFLCCFCSSPFGLVLELWRLVPTFGHEKEHPAVKACKPLLRREQWTHMGRQATVCSYEQKNSHAGNSIHSTQ